VVWANGSAYELANTSSRTTVSPMSASGSGTGAFVQASYSLNAVPGLRVTLRYEIADNPQSGAAADTMKVKITVQNTGASAITYGVRLMFDTEINGNDGANISVNNGFSVVSNNNIYTQVGAGIPGNWWGYDVAPPGVANLVGRGSLWGNPLGEAASMPDALEVALWGDTQGAAQWTPAPLGNSIIDSSVVLWWTGTGTAGVPVLSLGPGASKTFITYYGINSGTLLSTFTPTPHGTKTITPTFSQSPTRTPSRTTTPSHSMTPTFSESPSFSYSPTPTPTLTITSTPSASPTVTCTPTQTETPTVTATGTITPTFTISETFSMTATFSASPTFSPTRTITPTFTPTPIPLLLKLLPANPDPAGTEAWLPYHLSTDAEVDIQVWTVSGERVRGWDAGWRLAGYREERWDLQNEAGNAVGSGVFIYRIRAVSAYNETKQDFSKCAVAR
jgi:hypothetical protein